MSPYPRILTFSNNGKWYFKIFLFPQSKPVMSCGDYVSRYGAEKAAIRLIERIKNG